MKQFNEHIFNDTLYYKHTITRHSSIPMTCFRTQNECTIAEHKVQHRHITSPHVKHRLLRRHTSVTNVCYITKHLDNNTCMQTDPQCTGHNRTTTKQEDFEIINKFHFNISSSHINKATRHNRIVDEARQQRHVSIIVIDTTLSATPQSEQSSTMQQHVTNNKQQYNP